MWVTDRATLTFHPVAETDRYTNHKHSVDWFITRSTLIFACSNVQNKPALPQLKNGGNFTPSTIAAVPHFRHSRWPDSASFWLTFPELRWQILIYHWGGMHLLFGVFAVWPFAIFFVNDDWKNRRRKDPEQQWHCPCNVHWPQCATWSTASDIFASFVIIHNKQHMCNIQALAAEIMKQNWFPRACLKGFFGCSINPVWLIRLEFPPHMLSKCYPV